MFVIPFIGQISNEKIGGGSLTNRGQELPSDPMEFLRARAWISPWHWIDSYDVDGNQKSGEKTCWGW